MELLFAQLGHQVRGTFQTVGGVALMAARSLSVSVRPPIDLVELFRQCLQIGVRSISITTLTAIFAGMVFALQFMIALERFGAAQTVGYVLALAMLRELGPVLTALMVGGRVGAGIAAEIGSMQVTEQIDAIRALGADPIKKLVFPRVLAAMFMLPLLTIFTDVLGLTGGMVVSYLENSTPPLYFFQTVLQASRLSDLISGLAKTVFFGYFIALFGCYFGFSTKGGTEGVGRSTTRTVVVVSVVILISDFFLTKLFFMLF